MTDDAWERLQLIYHVAHELEGLQRLGREAVLGSTPHRRALERQIEIIGEVCRQLEQDSPDIAEELEARLPQVRWKGWRGLRNNVAHNLLNLDHEILWGAAVDGGPTLRQSLEQEYGGAMVRSRVGAQSPTLDAIAEPSRREPPQSARVKTPASTAAGLRLRLMYDVAGELEPLAALGQARVLERGVPRRAAERGAELIGEGWIQLAKGSPDVAGRLPVDGPRWQDVRRTLAKNLVHPDPHDLWRAVAEDAPRLRATLAEPVPDRRQRLHGGAPSLSRRRSQVRRFGDRAIGD